MNIDTEAIRNALTTIADALDAKAEAEPFRVTGPGVYETRGGDHISITRKFDAGVWRWTVVGGPSLQTWQDSGHFLASGVAHSMDLTRRIGDLPSEEREVFPWCGPGWYHTHEGSFLDIYKADDPLAKHIASPRFNWLDGGNPDTGALCIWGEGKFAVKAMVTEFDDGVCVTFGSKVGVYEQWFDDKDRDNDRTKTRAAAREWAEQQMAAELKRRAVKA